jgi:Ni,Fe-hydrogenase III large subunit/Ni,Fe-hydrogenase III component G
MDKQFADFDLTRVAGHDSIWRFAPRPARLPAVARAVQEVGGQLLALWGSDDRHLDGGFTLNTLFLSSRGLLWAQAALDAEDPTYPDLSHIFPQAGRMQRSTHDLLGIRPMDCQDCRKWLRHGAWPEGTYPLRRDFAGAPTRELDAYPFIRVAGDGVHEIPVGPIHAGTIEPGHFRFSIIGDRVLRLEERLGYTHQGVEKRFEGLDPETGARLAGRISGDSHSAFAWAYCMACEQASGTLVPERALWLRALFLEIERIANHLGDLGYLGNDVALSFGFVQFWRLKEDWLRLCARRLGHRYLFDRIVPGGVAADLDAEAGEEIARLAERVDSEVRQLKEIYDEHAVLQDRFVGTGIVKPELALRMGLMGLAGRASAQGWDARVQFPGPPYDRLDVQIANQRKGDVLARAEVRFFEVRESLRLVREILKSLPGGAIRTPLLGSAAGAEGLGWVEGWRGPVLVALRIGADGTLDRVYPHDPSWQNWPLLELAVLGNIVPDFPLINKSFNLSYSGPDL